MTKEEFMKFYKDVPKEQILGEYWEDLVNLYVLTEELERLKYENKELQKTSKRI